MVPAPLCYHTQQTPPESSMLHRGGSEDANNPSRRPVPTFMSSEQAGQPSTHATNLPFRSSPLKFFASSSVPTPRASQDSHKQWKAEFLTDLRSNRPARPSGSRPLPNRNAPSTQAEAIEPPGRTSSAMERPRSPIVLMNEIITDRCSSAMSHRDVQSGVSAMCTPPGKPFVQSPQQNITSEGMDGFTAIPIDMPGARYRERGQRWMEKQETRSVSRALHNMDFQDKERLRMAARNEASELVSKYRNSAQPYRNAEAPNNYKEHLRKGSHARSQSLGLDGDFYISNTPRTQGQRSVSDSSTSANSDREKPETIGASDGTCIDHGLPGGENLEVSVNKSQPFRDLPQKNAYAGLNFTTSLSNSSSKRRISGPKLRNSSAEKRTTLFRNPDDQIYEEPEDMVEGGSNVNWNAALVPPPLTLKPRNSTTKTPVISEPSELSAAAPFKIANQLSRHDIHKNPPSQSRNPSYVRNALPPTPPDSASASDNDEAAKHQGVRNGIEIRDKDIRAATSRRLKDRSPKLPTPTVVSDRPSRPIVSFDHDWKPRDVESQPEAFSEFRTSGRDGTPRALPLSPQKPRLSGPAASAPVVPTISIQTADISVSSVPVINVANVPSISISTPPASAFSIRSKESSSRPLPTPNAIKTRPLPCHSSTNPLPISTPHWSPSTSRATAQCAACALPISGRIVSAASQRFHPQCFSCFQCGELLECVAFYPEPDTFRSDRVARIRARAAGEEIPLTRNDHSKHPHPSEEEDGDESLRFYCHLDFHELFSPRCRSCKTPIEGEVVVACGGEWHVGHFFCAECGDPFDAQTPFVEKEGYAWCVDCHTRRYSNKCAGCRRPVVDMVVKALGKEWHGECFRCAVSDPLP